LEIVGSATILGEHKVKFQPYPLSTYTLLLDKEYLPLEVTVQALPIPGVPDVNRRKASDLIRLLPSRNLHHGIRLAARLFLPLNLFVSINFALTDCPEENTDIAFAKLRAQFGKWVRRPQKADRGTEAPPTFVWVIENQNGILNSHWLVHVPTARHSEFTAKLPEWLRVATGKVHSVTAIDIRPAHTPMAVEKYMLKGLHPTLARTFNIDHIPQGWVTGKRIGHSKNIGPVQVAEMRRQGVYPPARRWIPYKTSPDNPGISMGL
jgi:hypothetical protein